MSIYSRFSLSVCLLDLALNLRRPREQEKRSRMDGDPPKLPPPPPFVETETPNEAAQEDTRQPLKKPGRSIRDFFGKPTQVVDEAAERDSAVVRANGKGNSNSSVIDAAMLDGDGGKPEADTSVDSITLVEPMGKRKAGPTTMGAKKKTAGRKVTDEDAELREMEAAARKKQRLEGKTAVRKGKGKGKAVVVDDEDELEEMMCESRMNPRLT